MEMLKNNEVLMYILCFLSGWKMAELMIAGGMWSISSFVGGMQKLWHDLRNPGLKSAIETAGLKGQLGR